MALLAPDESPAFTVLNTDGSSAVVLVCDHASNRVPRRLDNLGLGTDSLNDHIAWDPGAADVARALSIKLDAVLIMSGYSRLVIDCNRPLNSTQLIATHSAGISIPGNQHLSIAERQQRIDDVFKPYHQAILHTLLQRKNRPTVLLSIHSFTPVLNGEQRPWQVGVSFFQDNRLALALRGQLQQHDGINVGFNQPYAVETAFDYTIPEHGEKTGLPSAMIELRQNEIATAANATAWANRLANAWHAIEPEFMTATTASTR